MKIINSTLFTITFLVGTLKSFGQQHTDLYTKIDSLIRVDLKFDMDSARKSNDENTSMIIRCAVSLPPYPVILLDGKIIDMSTIDHYHLSDIKQYEFIKPNARATALFGSQGEKGIIFIYSKHYKRPIHNFSSH